MDIKITPKGAKVLRSMIVSCGTAGCFEAIKRLDALKEVTDLSEIGVDEKGEWRMSVFQRLKWYAEDKKIEIFEVEDIVRYFGGNLHIEIMDRIADHAGLGSYLGKDVGLVAHILLPLENNAYSNQGNIINFENSVVLNPEEKGRPFYHLGAMINIDVADDVVRDILKEQANSDVFMKSLEKIDGQTIVLPDKYLKGLSCTAEKSNK